MLWPTVGYDGRTIVFERDFAVWLAWTPPRGQAAKDSDRPARRARRRGRDTHKNETSFDSLALSPDGKKAAIIAHGEVFAVSTKDGGAASASPAPRSWSATRCGRPTASG
ncbi:hypothetical protein ACRAWD_02155 [Caulobacter segnis]